MPANFRLPARLVMVAVATAISLTTASGVASAQQQPHDHSAPPAAAQPAAPDTAAADARLNSLLEAMKTAKGDARFTAMAAVISELAAQRTELRAQLQTLSSRPPADRGSNMEMMSHMMSMMSHMQGMMSGCTMMQGDHAPVK